jgi:hypothetical protein
MRAIHIGALVLFAPLLAGCDDAPVPELRGKWFSTQIARMRADRIRSLPQPPSTTVDGCSLVYLAFRKEHIVYNWSGRDTPLFWITDVRREGWRVSLTGRGNFYADGRVEPQVRIDLQLYKNEVRFEGVYDEDGGQRMQNEQLPFGHPLRRLGTYTIGDVIKSAFDAKRCGAA